jgi:hypothetical protein
VRARVVGHAAPICSPSGPGILDAALQARRGEKPIVTQLTNAHHASSAVEWRDAPHVIEGQTLVRYWPRQKRRGLRGRLVLA